MLTDPSILDLAPLLSTLGVGGQVLATISIYLGALITLCSVIDAYVPQPVAGSRWVPVRRLVTIVAHNVRFARNAVPAGSVPATVASAGAQVVSATETVTQAVGELQAVAKSVEAEAPVVAQVAQAAPALEALAAKLADKT